jgi:hypothetical protein
MTGFIRTESVDGCLVSEPEQSRQARGFWSGRVAASVVVLVGWVNLVAGQESGGGGVRVETSGRSFTVEALVVAVFLGLALFSVCRSSRRV